MPCIDHVYSCFQRCSDTKAWGRSTNISNGLAWWFGIPGLSEGITTVGHRNPNHQADLSLDYIGLRYPKATGKFMICRIKIISRIGSALGYVSGGTCCRWSGIKNIKPPQPGPEVRDSHRKPLATIGHPHRPHRYKKIPKKSGETTLRCRIFRRSLQGDSAWWHWSCHQGVDFSLRVAACCGNVHSWMAEFISAWMLLFVVTLWWTVT